MALNTTNYFVSLFSGKPQMIDFYSASAISAGQVVIINGIPHFSLVDFAAATQSELAFSLGTWKANKAAGAWTAGLPVYYGATLSPNVGTASSGAFTQTAASGLTFVGYALVTPGTTVSALTGDQFGYFVKANGAANISGSTGGQSIAAAGSTITDAAVLTSGFQLVTGADATKGAVLPATTGSIIVKNADAANAVLKVYPPSGGTINALSTSAAISMAAKTSAVFSSLDGIAFYTTPLLPS